MRLLAGIIVALFAAVGLAMAMREDPGYVLITRGSWTIEVSVAVLIVLLILLYLALYLALRYLYRLVNARSYINAARKRRAQRLLAKGLKSLAEGRWLAAETALIKSAASSETPGLNYVGAARAARELGVNWRSDSYMRRAGNVPPKDRTVVALTKAEFLLDDGKAAEARAVLQGLQAQNPHHPRLLQLLARTYGELGEWERLKALLPELRKRQALDQARCAELEMQTYRALLADAARTGTIEELQSLWKQVPERLRHDEGLVIEYAGYLRDSNAVNEAEALLQNALKREWSDKLVVGYGELGRGNFNSQLSVAEGWLKEHGDNPYLLLTLGRLAKRSRQYDKARSYLEKSIRVLPMPDAYQELAEVFEELKQPDNANLCYRNGLRLAAGREAEGLAKELAPVIEGIGALPAAEPSSLESGTLPEAGTQPAKERAPAS